MRKILTSSMVAGAALLVAACGGADTTANTTNMGDLGNDTMMDANADMGMDTNMSMDANATLPEADANVTTTTTTTTTDTNAQ
ncbi:MAG TPA: hypothetical protein VES64_10390 [Allosphingosinicella sp.]|nr:hypothetical protein [Allosphingosinicella sp.]